MTSPSSPNRSSRRRSLRSVLTPAAVILAACGGSPTLTPSPATDTSAPPTQTVTLPLTPAGRTARISQIVNIVEARRSSSEAWSAAVNDQIIPAGGSVQTKEDSTARLDLSEGTVVRLSPLTSFTVQQLDQDPSSPFTRLALEFGRIFIELSGGSMEVETPAGVAAVRGSLMSVSYDPVTGIAHITCLEGTCTVTAGGETRTLAPGQAVDWEGVDQPPGDSQPMSQEDFDAWREANPDLQFVVPPTATSTATNTPLPPPPPTPTATATQPTSPCANLVCPAPRAPVQLADGQCDCQCANPISPQPGPNWVWSPQLCQWIDTSTPAPPPGPPEQPPTSPPPTPTTSRRSPG